MLEIDGLSHGLIQLPFMSMKPVSVNVINISIDVVHILRGI